MKKNYFNHSQKYLDYLYQLDKEFYIDILENSYNEIYVTDREGNIIYVNPNSIKNYGMKPEDIIGKNNYDIWEGKWNPPVIKRCVKEKRTIFAEQTYLITGKEITTIVTPIFNEKNEVDLVLCVVQEAVNEYDISYKNIDAEAFEQRERRQIKKKRKFNSEIVGYSYDFCKILVRMQRVAQSEVPVMILGESGTGKSLLAEYIHENSVRKEKPFIMINCAAIPENLLESELFGYAPYAFTGANPKGKTGLIEMADGGTLFLDEIGDLAPSLQAKLLDVLENKRFIPVGGHEIRFVDIRIITATNRNLDQLVKEKKFREDLYWRINISTTTIPPLRDRRDDILPLLSFYLNKNNKKYGKKKDFAPNVIGVLLEYPWPGNVRQLKNLVELLFIMASGNTIAMNHLPEFILEEVKEPESRQPNSYEYIIDSVKKSVIRDYYKRYATSRELGLALGLSQTKANRLINDYCSDLLKEKENKNKKEK
ncbi:MAG: sigma-54 interaction domain-containing protein [Eubacteriaceae bacterium]